MNDEYQKCYETLELAPGASQSEIKKAYFRLVRACPPDREPERFQEIRRAYEMLREQPAKEAREEFPPPEEPAIQSVLRLVNRELGLGHFQTAADYIGTALASKPDDPYLLLRAARLQMRSGHPRKAARTAQKLSEIAPSCCEAYAITASGFYEGGWYKKALPAFQKAYALGAENLVFLVDYADAAEANGLGAEAEKLRRELLRDTKWDRSNIETAVYLYARLSESCKRETEAILALLDNYSAFTAAHKRLVRTQGEELFIPVMQLFHHGMHLPGIYRIYCAVDALLEAIGELLGEEWSQVAGQTRRVAVMAALAADRRFDGTPWEYYAHLVLFPEPDGSRMQRYALLDALLCLMKKAGDSRREAEVIRNEYPVLYRHCREEIDLLAAGDTEQEFERKKREYVRLSEFCDGGAFFELYPEERPAPKGVLVHSDETPFVRQNRKVGRNDPCPCGSGRKFKRCCLGKGLYD